MLTTENDWVKSCWSFYLRLFYGLPGFIYEIIWTKDYLKKTKKVMTRNIVLGIIITPILQFCHMYGLIYGAANLI